jgi:16S rRNA (cytosine967-C5)-methyltransferase
MALRVNPMRVGQAAFLKALTSDGIDAQPGMFPESVRIRGSARIDTLTGFDEGWFSVQDESAMAVTDLLAPQSGESILDLCAAPGGKTTHMAERMRDEGRIIACDVSEGRLRQIRESADRLGLDIIETWRITTDGDNVPEGPFDAVAVDAPCSNTGVIGKRPEVRWRLRPEDLVELPGIQGMLLRTAASRVRPGGRLVYSTCSIDQAENGDVVAAFLESQPDFTLEREQPAVPGRPGDGGYAALLRRQ